MPLALLAYRAPKGLGIKIRFTTSDSLFRLALGLGLFFRFGSL